MPPRSHVRPKTVTRAQLTQAVERGIDQALNMSDHQKALLRHVAATTDKAAYGTFRIKDVNGNVCGCPLTLAGLTETSPTGSIKLVDGVSGFYAGYDNALNNQVGLYNNLVEVVG